MCHQPQIVFHKLGAGGGIAETQAVKNWQSFAELFDAPDRSDAEKLTWIRGELEAGYPRFSREDYREALRWLMDYMERMESV